MEIYETEEQQVEALKRWWQENSTATLIGLGLGIVFIVGWNYWQDYRSSQAQQASALYAELMKAMEANKKDSVEKLAEQIQTKFTGSEYALYSGLMLAKVKIQKDDLAGAQQVLDKLATDSNKEISNIAKIRLVRILLAKKEYEQGLKLINEIDPATSASFSGEYDELIGDLYVGLDRLDQARTSYQSALRNGQQSPLLQMKIDDLTPPEKLESKK